MRAAIKPPPKKNVGTVSVEAAKRIAADIAERRERPTGEQIGQRIERERMWKERPCRPAGASIYDVFCRPRGLAMACNGCQRHVVAGANCPGRDPADDWRTDGLVPDCHSLHDEDREAVQAALDERERLVVAS